MSPPTTRRRAPRCTPVYGRCSQCTTPLQSWLKHPEKRGTIVLQAELGCPMCQETRVQVHAAVCLCQACSAGEKHVHNL